MKIKLIYIFFFLLLLPTITWGQKRIHRTYFYAQPAYYGPEFYPFVDTYPYWNQSDYPCYHWYSPYSCNGNPCTYPDECGCYPEGPQGCFIGDTYCD